MARTLNIPLPTGLANHNPVEVPLPSIFHEKFDIGNYKLFLNGLQKASKSKIVVCGCVRDIHPHTFNNNLGKVFSLCKRFKDFHVILIENDSGPIFKKHLQTLRGNDDVTVISNDYGYPSLGAGRDYRRVSIMAFLRNSYLSVIKNRFQDFDYTIVVDFDLADWRIDGIFNSLGYQKWDMIGANGLQLKKDTGKLIYYDTFALIEASGRTYPTQQFKDAAPLNVGREYVMACFGGVGLYRTKSLLKGKSYDLYKMDNEYVSEQCGIHINMARNGCGNISINPNMIVVR